MPRFLLLLLAAIGAVLVLVAITSKLYRIPTASMEPKLHCSKDSGTAGCVGESQDRIAVSRVLYKVREPKRGDIVAYELPARAARLCGAPRGSTFVHRIVGLPGETVRVRAGVVFVDGRRLAEPYVKPGRRDMDSYPPLRIGSKRYVVLGDNRRQSCDSRVWGLVPRENVIGPRIATYWPLDRISVR